MPRPAANVQRPATYQDLLDAPEHLIAEILDGELILSPRPASPHAHAVSMLGIDVGGPFMRRRGGYGPGGWWILYEPELHLDPDVLVPDLAGWRRERMPTVPRVAWFELPPDWVCEVLSPSSAGRDRLRKMRTYARAGLSHVWLIDPLARLLESYRLQDGLWLRLGSWGGDELVRAEPFAEVELELSAWWLPEDETAAGPVQEEPVGES